MKIWLLADPHFGHLKLIKYCGRPRDFSERILENLKEVLKPEDVLLCLGDVCMGEDTKWNSLVTSVSTCKKWLVLGNHDKKSLTWYMGYWDFVGDILVLNRFGKTILFSHVPKNEHEFLYDINIHGHLHNNYPWYSSNMFVSKWNRKQMLHAVEFTDYYPITLQSMVNRFDNRNR